MNSESRVRKHRATGQRPQAAKVAILAVSLLFLTFAASPSPALAYATNGCKWPINTLNIDNNATAQYAAPLNSAINNWSVISDVNLTSATSGTFAGRNGNYGANGYAGYANTTCPFGVTTAVDAWVNEYYAASYNSTAVKVLWLHELGHGLGLAHVTTVARVMYGTPISAYNAGVQAPTPDDISGMNFLY